eukprot:gnl/Hemi2/25219_TR8476_c0_g1_i1.p1 gnl/Hemi2/25219_TR8476_c0_g1~~gnl/Hemi2/25219_TR8476_c0_g1_i1.p1  ORF type:complete len:214 (+),score=18.14 gnl/Hemi2/25219_TR8476_c0_g1_i1:115-756(+)
MQGCTVEVTGALPVSCLFGGTPGLPCALLLHGWGRSSSNQGFRWLYEPLIQNGYFVLAPDMPGFGASAGRRHSCRSEANLIPHGPVDVIRAVLQHFHIDVVTLLIGYSWGGGVAVSFTSACPNRVQKMVLFHGSYTDDGKTLRNIHNSTLILWVPVDQVHPVSLGRSMAAVLPRCRLQLLDCGRFHADKPLHNYESISSQITEAILSFAKEPT